MNRDRSELYETKVTDDLASFLSVDKRSVSATKIAGILGLSNMDGYAIKARVEYMIQRIIPEVEKEEGVKIRDVGEYAAWLKKEDAAFIKARTEAEEAKEKDAKNGKEA